MNCVIESRSEWTYLLGKQTLFPMPYYISQVPTNPLARVFAVVLGVLAIAGALFFGLIVLTVVFAVGLFFWLGLRLRMWWLQRHLQGVEVTPVPPAGKSDPIEAEYTVISRQSD